MTSTSKPFPIQRKRVGQIRYIRDDVFFHRMSWQSPHNQVPQEKMAVEFEIDDDHYREKNQLRAKVVRPTGRPLGRKLSGRDAPHLIIKHHPKARKKRPDWRK